jgi:hypothetical protein
MISIDLQEKREKFKKFFRIDWIIRSIDGRIKKMNEYVSDNFEKAMFERLKQNDIRISILFPQKYPVP